MVCDICVSVVFFEIFLAGIFFLQCLSLLRLDAEPPREKRIMRNNIVAKMLIQFGVAAGFFLRRKDGA